MTKTDREYLFGKPADTHFIASADILLDGWIGFNSYLYYWESGKYMPTDFHRHIKNYPENL